ncbi:hypothetical protein [Azospirillum picis]|uniref:Uncharacterized protein n=1 Tax=Azospirillum picis TaxID=488438 RepID=A0ABU0MD94_9PROT|nr:hypothetical protein [Azospirillum picis]MBP2297579.1 hypothetical protein [Azospirillum picis]MDQ0531398.1 hypothetical protein [Azospirillum picis]
MVPKPPQVNKGFRGAPKPAAARNGAGKVDMTVIFQFRSRLSGYLSGTTG